MAPEKTNAFSALALDELPLPPSAAATHSAETSASDSHAMQTKSNRATPMTALQEAAPEILRRQNCRDRKPHSANTRGAGHHGRVAGYSVEEHEFILRHWYGKENRESRAIWSGEVADFLSYSRPDRGVKRMRRHIAIICKPSFTALLCDPVTELSPTRS